MTRSPVAAALVSLSVAAAVGLAGPAAAAAPESAAAVAAASEAAAAVRAVPVVATGSVLAAGFEVARDGRVFYGGPSSPAVRVWSPATRASTTFATVPRGIRVLGLTLHPRFPATPYVYVFAVVRTATNGNRLQLLRYTASGSTGTGVRLLRDVAPLGTDHSGGKITFTPDGAHLVLVVGDGGNPATAQDPTSGYGKVHRLTPLGAPVAGNPGGGTVFASGFRNSIGLAYDPVSKALWETENGPECGDELNRVRPGANYGWGPKATCAPGTVRGTNQDGPSPVLPATWYPRPAAPTGAEFCDGCGLPGAQGGLLYGRYLQKDVRLATLDAARTDVASERTLYQHSDVVLAIERDPRDGAVWFSDTTGIRRLVP